MVFSAFVIVAGAACPVGSVGGVEVVLSIGVEAVLATAQARGRGRLDGPWRCWRSLFVDPPSGGQGRRGVDARPEAIEAAPLLRKYSSKTGTPPRAVTGRKPTSWSNSKSKGRCPGDEAAKSRGLLAFGSHQFVAFTAFRVFVGGNVALLNLSAQFGKPGSACRVFTVLPEEATGHCGSNSHAEPVRKPPDRQRNVKHGSPMRGVAGTIRMVLCP